ncbi:hypothetical protein ACFL1S_04020 [Pseudomonadota bacterium]
MNLTPSFIGALGGRLIEYRAEQYSVALSFQVRTWDHWERMERTVRLDRTPCHFGGTRPWFFCPGCDQRVLRLFFLRSRLHCRQCHRLTYTTQREDRAYRLLRKIRRIRQRLGAHPSPSVPIFGKPKGMSLDTFDRLWLEEREANLAHIEAVMASWRPLE